MIGQTIGHYQIVEKLGEGGMGIVYKATDTKLNRPVALKFLPHHLTSTTSEQERMLQEARAAAALNHPNVCSVIDLHEAHGHQFIVMEYVEGATLRQMGPMAKLDVAIGHAIQIGEALHVAHAKGIVHRDVKSENVMITSDGRVKVMDFGLARLKGTIRLTKESSTVGTLGYMAPEQIQGGEADARSDIFSFGVVVFEMLTGKLPFRGEHDAALMYSILNEQPESLDKYIPDVSSELTRIIRRALEKDPADRYQHIDDMVSELRLVRKHSQRVVRPETIGVQAPPSGKRRRASAKTLVAGAAAVIIVISGVTLFLLNSPRQSREPVVARKMLVVLPFENLGAPEQEYFADGLTGEVTSKLAGVSGLTVIARSSAMQYKHTTKTLKQIGEELKVDYLLEGTLQWADNDHGGKRIRVNPELIKVVDETQIWSQPYEAEYSDAFKLQADIATTVAEALNIKLVTSEQRSLQERLTSSPEAYDMYLRALQYGENITNEGGSRIAEQMLSKAIELDSDFAAAYAELSTVQSNMYWEYFERTEKNLNNAMRNAQRALALNPELAAAHLAMGDYYYHGRLEYDLALREYNEALRLQPNNAGAYNGIGFVLRRQGKMRQAVESMLKSLDLDPRNYTTVFSVGETYLLLREYDKALPYLLKARSLTPDAVGTYDYEVWSYLLKTGDTKAARKVIQSALGRKIGEGSVEFTMGLLLCDLCDGNFSDALKRLNVLGGGNPGRERRSLDTQFFVKPEELLSAQVYGFMKNSTLSHTKYDSARIILEKRVAVHPEDSRLHSSLGIAYAGLGRKSDAIREGKRGVELLPIEKEAWRGSYRLLDLAQIYTMVGEQDLALGILADLISRPTDAISAALLNIDPTWQPLRQHPRFQRLVRDASTDRPK